MTTTTTTTTPNQLMPARPHQTSLAHLVPQQLPLPLLGQTGPKASARGRKRPRPLRPSQIRPCQQKVLHRPQRRRGRLGRPSRRLRLLRRRHLVKGGRASIRSSINASDDDQDANDNGNDESDDADDDDDDDDEFGPARAKAKRKPKRSSAPRLSSADLEASRVSSRNAKRIPNYTDDYADLGDDDPFEDEADIAAQQHALQAGTIEEEDVIESIVGHERHEDRLDEPEDIPTQNLRFIVKWKGYSHLHDTHETYDFLKRYRGFKRVDNYIKHVFYRQKALLSDPNASREDIEALQIERERQAELIESFKTVERIIAQRNNDANKDIPYPHLAYLVKWKGLPYADCTWRPKRRSRSSPTTPSQPTSPAPPPPSSPGAPKTSPRADPSTRA